MKSLSHTRRAPCLFAHSHCSLPHITPHLPSLLVTPVTFLPSRPHFTFPFVKSLCLFVIPLSCHVIIICLGHVSVICCRRRPGLPMSDMSFLAHPYRVPPSQSLLIASLPYHVPLYHVPSVIPAVHTHPHRFILVPTCPSSVTSLVTSLVIYLMSPFAVSAPILVKSSSCDVPSQIPFMRTLAPLPASHYAPLAESPRHAFHVPPYHVPTSLFRF